MPFLTQQQIIDFITSQKEFLRERYGVSFLALFGTFARNEARSDSDIDLLIVFEEGRKTFDNYWDVKFFLEDHFHRKVDLVTEKALAAKKTVATSVKQDMVQIYEG